MRTTSRLCRVSGGILPLVLLAVILIMAAPQGQARSPDRPVVLLSCPGGHGPYDPLCQAMIQTLAQAASGHAVIRRVPRGQEAPGRAGDLGIALHVSQRGDAALAGHLVWQTGRGGPSRKGPALRMTADGADLSHHAFQQFTQGLLKATPDLIAALRAAA